jgi:hypothetical protein
LVRLLSSGSCNHPLSSPLTYLRRCSYVPYARYVRITASLTHFYVSYLLILYTSSIFLGSSSLFWIL